MGLDMFSGSEGWPEIDWSKYRTTDSKNPNPKVFNILQTIQIYNHLLAIVQYPNCSNFEGKKILLYLNTKKEDFEQLTEVDPHFTDEVRIRPFARFEPTDKGLEIAYLTTLFMAQNFNL